MLHIRGIDHVVLRVRDLDRMLAFYRDVLGCDVERRLDSGLTQLRAGDSLIDLVPIGEGEEGASDAGRNLDHFCLRVEPFDEDAILDRLEQYGHAPGPVEERYGAHGFGPSIYVDDPEGNRLELKGPPPAQEREAGTTIQRMSPSLLPASDSGSGSGSGGGGQQQQQQQQQQQ